jgi:hypothetical protein
VSGRDGVEERLFRFPGPHHLARVEGQHVVQFGVDALHLLAEFFVGKSTGDQPDSPGRAETDNPESQAASQIRLLCVSANARVGALKEPRGYDSGASLTRL